MRPLTESIPPNQIQRLRTYMNISTWKKNRIRYRLLGEAAGCCGKVTLNRIFLRNVKFYPHHPVNTTMPLHQKNEVGKTFFKEVQVAPPIMSEAVRQYAQNPKPPPVKEPIKKLMEIMESYWNPDEFHLQLHSSGYDSRIISGILMKLREKHGAGWIGDILFLCWEPDGAHFKNIMKWEGWKRSQYHVYREGVGMDYRSELVEFKDVWRWVNDYSFPHLVIGPAVEEAKRMGLAPKDRDIHVIIGISSVVQACSWKLPKPRVHYPNPQINGIFMKREVHTNFAMWQGMPCKEIYVPFADVRAAVAMGNHAKRMEMLKRFNRSLYNLPRYPHKSAYYKPNWLNGPTGLSKETRLKAARDFNRSWYAKETGQPEIDISPDLGHGMTQDQDRWWRNYVLASTCEYLINKGVKIII